MTSPRDEFDWQAAEADVNTTGGPDAHVVDLDAARAARTTGPTAADAGEGGQALVDSPDAQRAPRFTLDGARVGQRRPILPAWLRSRAELHDVMRWTVGHLLHTSGYHLVRVPKYLGKLAWRAPVGAGRLLTAAARWLFDWEGESLRQATARRDAAEDYLKLSRQRDRRVRWRGIVATLTTALTLTGGTAMLWAPTWAQWTVPALLATLCGMFGQPADRPLLDTAVVVPRVARLTSDVVVRALVVLGIAGINQAIAKQGARAIGFTAPIVRDGPGWRADVDLPPGVTAGDVIERRDRLAAGLTRPLGCVWPEGMPEVHPGRLMLWVGDQDMATARQPAWPLAKAGGFDLSRPVPFGTDPRGRIVAFDLPYTNVLIGSIPGYGKTAAIQVPMLAAALDPHTELWCFEFKGTGGLDPLAKVATRYASGADDDTAEQGLEALRELRKECQRRAAVIKGLPKAVCPDNKVTPELARRKNLGLRWLVAAFDEIQELFSHPEFGKEAGELAEKVIKLGRALGVILLFATQRPDAKSLPTGVSANVGTRFCLRVMGQLENDMVLGTSAYKNGVRATMFTRKDKGVGYLVGAADDAQIVRTFYVDGPTAERITDRARALREQAGTLTGHAAGQETVTPAARRDTLLDDILTVVPAGEAKVWTEILTERLADLRPDVYGDLTRDQLTAALKPYGITTGQVWGTDPTTGRGANRRGIDRTHVADTVAERNRQRRDKAA
ncbi:FtsK/SpoIIIE domain-containing protein [Micromonospora sp. WMMD882]|uniref:FtsK/SpoIIIE domain-containing protein n=1 Tax=Micromonospora sp. WMMD882 TaxID=3015151 RepID=UPI00248CF45F|nr:FtsK/SpoIIIE domain-containing protein [Micromonospora sp. WMMD882]WBB81288.1 FtsK/SpoIIIE domain-containing protein [Micromonospora sp. WMMD882]